jgi:hypothetical protein
VASAVSDQYQSRVTGDLLSALRQLDTASTRQQEAALEEAVEVMHALPWKAPRLSDVETLHKETQYGAWVLVHGNNVNHFTALINSHQVAGLDSIDKTAAALAAAAVPMKPDIEGAEGSRLRQTATAAVKIPARMTVDGACMPPHRCAAAHASSPRLWRRSRRRPRAPRPPPRPAFPCCHLIG